MTDWNKNVKFVRLLDAHHDSKTAVVEGEAEDKDGVKQPAVLFFEKAPLEYDELSKLMQENGEQFKLDFVNDIYYKYAVEARQHCNEIKLSYIFPATPAHIAKYAKKDLALISETADAYKTIVRPYMEKNQFNPQWVYNILDGKSERERTLFSDDQFALLLNYNWDGKAIESMYLLALVRDRDIHSIRDLKPKHIPLLESLLEKSIETITTKFDIRANFIRAFFHYPPTFYHLHVHFTRIDNNTCGCEAERGHLVQDVIDHLKMDGDYFEKKTMHYKLATNNPLYDLLTEKKQPESGN